MTLLILGLALWYLSHLFKRIAPGLRAGMGDLPAKLLVTVASLVAIALMIRGFRAAEVVMVWSPPAFLTHVNNLLMLIAVFLLNLGYSRGRLRARVRHPMLLAVKTWAVAHLLVNGDRAGMVLFGGLLVWAVLSVILINRQEPGWNRPAPGPLRNDLIYAVIALGVFAVITSIHARLGVWPFG